MARRRIGQERLRFNDATSRSTGSLDEIKRLIDGTEIDRHLAPIYAAAKGEKACELLRVSRRRVGLGHAAQDRVFLCS
jgi:transposase, IS5 family